MMLKSIMVKESGNGRAWTGRVDEIKFIMWIILSVFMIIKANF